MSELQRANPIQLLDSLVVGKIAAGEVLERPANLVKELVENSLDANARQIDVTFEEGGRRLEVRDDGWGIPPEELALALTRHATSKIHSAEDLWKLKSFGFRGEALASMAAVGRVTLTSRTPHSAEAARIRSDFGKLSAVETVGGHPGTTVSVDELFENVPARLKFLKSEGAEGVQIKRVLRAQAMIHPEVGFRIFQKGKLIHFYPAVRSLGERVRQVFEGHKLFEAMDEYEGIKVRAFLGSPGDVERTAQDLWFFVQSRWVMDRSLQSAVIEAYRHLLMHGEYPRGAILVEVPTDFVDVNVHPAKAQVRFREPSKVFRAVHHTIRGALEKAPWRTREPEKGTLAVEENATPSLFQEDRTHFRRKELPSDLAPDRSTAPFSMESNKESNIAPVEGVREIASPGQPYWGRLEVLGQANLTYVVAQGRNSLILVDQHAAHERVAFERLMARWRTEAPEIQPLLVPRVVELPEDQVEVLMEHEFDLRRMGLELDSLGPEQVSLRAVPAGFKDSSMQLALQQFAEEALRLGGSFKVERVIGDVFASMACHSVVRAGQALSPAEMRKLLEEMDEYPLSSFCPHGRPVYFEMTWRELDRNFGRIL